VQGIRTGDHASDRHRSTGMVRRYICEANLFPPDNAAILAGF
jgi:hypothetical protein